MDVGAQFLRHVVWPSRYFPSRFSGETSMRVGPTINYTVADGDKYAVLGVHGGHIKQDVTADEETAKGLRPMAFDENGQGLLFHEEYVPPSKMYVASSPGIDPAHVERLHELAARDFPHGLEETNQVLTDDEGHASAAAAVKFSQRHGKRGERYDDGEPEVSEV